MNGTATASDLRLGTGYQDIIRIALPITLALVVPQINFLTNNIFLSQLGEDSLAAAGLTGVFYLIFAVIGGGLNSGLQMLMARKAGQNRPGQIALLFRQNTRITLLFGAAGILLTYTLGAAILRATVSDAGIADRVVEFLEIRILGLPLLYLYGQRNALLVGLGKTRWLVLGTMAEALANILLDYLLIFGIGGFPELGFNGAAWASVFAEGIGLLAVSLAVRISGAGAIVSDAGRKNPIRLRVVRVILYSSSPLIVQFAISIITWEYFYILIEHHGARELAISTTMRNIFGLAGIFFWAFASTTNTMVSNIIGQRREPDVLPLVGKIALVSLAFCSPVLLTLNIWPEFFLGVYGLGPSFITAAIPVVHTVSIALLVTCVGAVWLNAVTGSGRTRVNLMIEALAIVIYLIYVTLVLGVYRLSLVWGWASEIIYWSCLLVCSFWYMRRGGWRRNDGQQLTEAVND